MKGRKSVCSCSVMLMDSTQERQATAGVPNHQDEFP